MKRVVSFVAIAAVAFALTGGTAFAATGSATFHEVTGGGCGLGTDSHGTARWDTETATVQIRVRKLSPNTAYQVQEVAGCSGGNVETLGTLMTNNGGRASGSFPFTAMGVRSFQLVPTTGTAYSTEMVNLGT